MTNDDYNEEDSDGNNDNDGDDDNDDDDKMIVMRKLKRHNSKWIQNCFLPMEVMQCDNSFQSTKWACPFHQTLPR